MEDKRKTLESYFYKDEFGNYIINEFEDLGMNLDFEDLNLLTRSLNVVGNYIETLQQELSKANDKLKKIEEYIKNKQVIDLDYVEKIIEGND